MIDLLLYVITVGKIVVNLARGKQSVDSMGPWLGPNFSACTAVGAGGGNGENPVDPENRLRRHEWRRFADARSMSLIQMC